MPVRFAFRQVDRRDLATFFKDGEVRAKRHRASQACHQTSHRQIVQRRNEHLVDLPHGGVVNDYVAFYFSPITAFTFAIHKGSVEVTSPNGTSLGASSLDTRAFLVANVSNLFAKYEHICFSNYALNTAVPLPEVVCDQRRFETHINWAQFDDSPLGAAIPELGYEGVCRYFNSSLLPPGRQHRSTERMAELLVKNAVSISDICAVVVPNENIRESAARMANANGYQGLVLSNPGCFI